MWRSDLKHCRFSVKRLVAVLEARILECVDEEAQSVYDVQGVVQTSLERVYIARHVDYYDVCDVRYLY